jgi:N-acetylglucosaminyldiphosphoundecaprenol N-acetyl-beta-D-mannosaminyltransferase
MSSRSNFEIFGLVIHGYNFKEIDQRINEAAKHARPFWIVTANPEILLQARKNPADWQVLRQANLRIVDGFGLQLMGWISGARPKRQSGADLAFEILRRAEKENWKVAFVGGAEGVAEKAAREMRKKFSHLKIYAAGGGRIDAGGAGDAKAEQSLKKILEQKPEVVLAAFGHPKQEAWIARHSQDFSNLKIILGVGGTFDFWAGRIKRAPKFMRSIGLEWLWRLFLEPKRWRRIFNAVIIFPCAVLKNKFSRP